MKENLLAESLAKTICKLYGFNPEETYMSLLGNEYVELYRWEDYLMDAYIAVKALQEMNALKDF